MKGYPVKKYKTERVIHKFRPFYMDRVEVVKLTPDEVCYRWIMPEGRRIDAFSFRSPELRALMKERREKDGYYYMPGVEERRRKALKNYLRRIYCVWRSGYAQAIENDGTWGNDTWTGNRA